MRSQSTLSKLSAFALAMGMCTIGAVAQDDTAGPAYVAQGVVYGLPGADQGAAFKGEVVLQDGGLASAMFEAAGVEVEIRPTDGIFYSMVVTTGGQMTAYGLRGAAVTVGDMLTLQGEIVDANENIEVVFIGSEYIEAQLPQEGSVAGGEPDVTASRIGLTSGGNGSDDFEYYGSANGIRAFAIASTSCNVGNATAEWISGSAARHPVIAQHVYRLNDNRFEQIGQSFLKHSFCAVSEFTCGACQSTNCNTLGIGCADTYWADLNDGGDGGRKSDINPMGMQIAGVGPGTHDHPYNGPSGDPAAIRGRLQIKDTDILAGGQFFAEIQYVTHDEIVSNRHNNASHREINLSLNNMSGVGSGQDSVEWMKPAIRAWKSNNPSVKEGFVDDPDGGRYFISYLVTDNGNGTWHYEYAIQNLNSDISAGSFSIPLPAGTVLTNVGFHDVDYHSGEPYDNSDWGITVGTDAVVWETTPAAQNPNANALRWGTLYNFRFDANVAPANGVAQLGMFKEPGDVDVNVDVPGGVPPTPCPWDLDGDGSVGVTDLVQLILVWGSNQPEADFDGDGTVGVTDLVEMITNWGGCPE